MRGPATRKARVRETQATGGRSTRGRTMRPSCRARGNTRDGGYARTIMKKIGFLSFGHWQDVSGSEVKTGQDALLHAGCLVEGEKGPYARFRDRTINPAKPALVMGDRAGVTRDGLAWLQPAHQPGRDHHCDKKRKQHRRRGVGGRPWPAGGIGEGRGARRQGQRLPPYSRYGCRRHLRQNIGLGDSMKPRIARTD